MSKKIMLCLKKVDPFIEEIESIKKELMEYYVGL